MRCITTDSGCQAPGGCVVVTVVTDRSSSKAYMGVLYAVDRKEKLQMGTK